jgi:MFS family permease
LAQSTLATVRGVPVDIYILAHFESRSLVLPDGRRPVPCYLLPFSIAGSIGVAFATTIPQLLFFRFFQAFGVSSGVSVGAGVIGDIYKLEERGMAMGIFFAVCNNSAIFGVLNFQPPLWCLDRLFYWAQLSRLWLAEQQPIMRPGG